MDKPYYLGIDVGGTKCAVLAGTEDMELLERIQFATETDRGPDYAIKRLLEKASRVVDKLTDCQLQAIGISCGGPLDSKKGLIQSPPNLPGWDNIPIVQMFKDIFNVPVYLQNDANACALAEWKFGAGKGTDNMVFLTFGTGMGAGLVLNGRLYTGTNDLAGEVGHVRLAEDGPEGFGKKRIGCIYDIFTRPPRILLDIFGPDAPYLFNNRLHQFRIRTPKAIDRLFGIPHPN